jgi:hypothetical protein
MTNEHDTSTISEAKLRANRLNASKSTGPKTPEGKRRSSLNSLRSGITGQIHSLPAEDLAVYQKQLDEILAEYNPVGPTERFYAASVAENMFRISRCRALENGMFANGFREHIDCIDAGHPEVDASLAGARTFEEQGRQIALLSVYEGRLRRTLEKDLAALKALQVERKEKYERAADQATAFVRYAVAREEEYEPGDDFQPATDWGGFVFSEPELLRRYNRRLRYEDARDYCRTGEDPRPKPENDPEIDMAA